MQCLVLQLKDRWPPHQRLPLPSCCHSLTPAHTQPSDSATGPLLTATDWEGNRCHQQRGRLQDKPYSLTVLSARILILHGLSSSLPHFLQKLWTRAGQIGARQLDYVPESKGTVLEQEFCSGTFLSPCSRTQHVLYKMFYVLEQDTLWNRWRLRSRTGHILKQEHLTF